MIKRAAALLSAAVLALLLAGCGSSGPSGSEKASSSDPGKGASASPTTSAKGGTATGADYRNLLADLIEQRTALQGATNAKQINNKAHFPEGVSIAQFDKASRTLCIESAPKSISLTFSSQDMVLHRGTCGDSKDVATLRPQGQNQLAVTGDKALAEPVRAYFVQQFGS